MFKKEGSETFIINFIFLVLGFLMKDLTSFEASSSKAMFGMACLYIMLFLPITLITKKEIPSYLILFKVFIYASLSIFYLTGNFFFFEIAFILFVISIFVFIFLESSYFSKYKMIKNFEENL